MARADSLKYFDAIKVRHHDIEKDEIELLFCKEVERHKAAFGPLGDAPFPFEAPREKLAIVHHVVDYEHPKRIFLINQRHAPTQTAGSEYPLEFNEIPLPQDLKRQPHVHF